MQGVAERPGAQTAPRPGSAGICDECRGRRYLTGVGSSSASLVAGGWLAGFFGVVSGEPTLFREMLSASRATALALAFSFSRSV